MGFYRVLKAHDFVTQTGATVRKEAGAIVEVMTRTEVRRLTLEGVIGPFERSYKRTFLTGQPAECYRRTKRVGFWINTSQWYSGGRIHMYQFALSLAQLGAETYIITDGFPKWRRDYPECDNLRVVIDGADPVPSDIDIIVTDTKGGFGRRAIMYRDAHPWATFACFNFETPNWVAEFCPDYAKALNQGPEVFQKADLLLANSRESALWLNRWLSQAEDGYVGVLPPAVNTYALEKARGIRMPAHDRPYAVWSARSPSYKGGDVAIEAVKSLPFPFDLVMIGQPRNLPENTKDHKFVPMELASDVDKYALMMGAVCVLAPSKFEGCGMVPMESLACGTPCIAYDLPVLREVYGDRIMYAKWGDREDFKRLVRTVAEGAERHARDGVEGLSSVTRPQSEAVAAEFGMDAMQEKVETIPHFQVGRKRLSVQLLAYWGFAPEALESVYAHADEIFVAYGRVPHAKAVDDGTLERLREFPDPDGKIVIEARDIWNGGKREMRQWCIDRMSGNFHLLLDGDEIWTGLDEWLEADIAFGCPRWVNLWHGPEHWVHDYPGETHRWGKPVSGGGSVCPHYRWSWLRRSYRFRSHPTMVDANDQPLHIIGPEAAEKVPECVIYHLGHALPKAVMEAKHDFYLSRDGVDERRVKRKKAWHDWNGQPGDCGDGIVEPVDWSVPDIVKRAYERIAEWQVK